MQDYQDRLRITTPEGLELELQLAGLGSRFSATLIDLLLKAALIVGLIFALGSAGDWGVFGVLIGIFAVYFGYDVVFEVAASGRTPGKRATGLRVLRLSGAPVDLTSSVVRNVLRLVDGLPLSYLPGMASILVTRHNQRLGDLAAGTIVVRERQGGRRRPRASASADPAVAPVADAWLTADLSAVTDEEVAAVRAFLERREGFAAPARAELAGELATRLRAKVVGIGAVAIDHERFLEQLARAKSR